MYVAVKGANRTHRQCPCASGGEERRGIGDVAELGVEFRSGQDDAGPVKSVMAGGVAFMIPTLPAEGGRIQNPKIRGGRGPGGGRGSDRGRLS